MCKQSDEYVYVDHLLLDCIWMIFAVWCLGDAVWPWWDGVLDSGYLGCSTFMYYYIIYVERRERNVIIVLPQKSDLIWSDLIRWLFCSTSKWPFYFFFARIPTTLAVFSVCILDVSQLITASTKEMHFLSCVIEIAFKSIHQLLFPALPLSLLHKQNININMHASISANYYYYYH